MTPPDPYKNIEQLTLQQLEVNPKQYVWTMRYFLSVWQGCENAFSSFGCLFNLLETMLWVRLRCSRVCRINHQKCVTFLPPNLSYLALKIAHYSFIALKDDCSFLFRLFPVLGRASSVVTTMRIANTNTNKNTNTNRFTGLLPRCEWMGCLAVTGNCVACGDPTSGKRVADGLL